MQCDLSPTFQSSALHAPRNTDRITISDPHYSRYLTSSARQGSAGKKWGRHWSYGGIGPFSLADFSQFDPYGQPVPAGKGHKHWGSGLDPCPRGVPIEQMYTLTDLKLSNLRWNDELVPRSLSTNVAKEELGAGFPADHPMHSHTAHHSVFPDIEISPEGVLVDDVDGETLMEYAEGAARGMSARPRSAAQKAREGQAMHVPRSGKVTVVHKTRGASARHEKIISLTGNEEELTNSQRPTMHDVWDTARSRPHQRALTYPAPRTTYSARPEHRAEMMVRPRTARLLQNMQTKSCYKTTYQQQHTERGVKHIDSIDDYEQEQEKAQLAREFPEDTESAGSADEFPHGLFKGKKSATERRFLPPASAVSRKMQTADLGGDGYSTGYHVPKPREGRHSRTAASMMKVADPEIEDEYGDVGIDGRCRPGTARARSAGGVRFGAQVRATSSRQQLRPGTPWVRRPGTGRYRPTSDLGEESVSDSSEDEKDTPRNVRIDNEDDGDSIADYSEASSTSRPPLRRSVSLGSAMTAKAVPDEFADGWRPGTGYPRPRSSFHNREATFSKSLMHQQLHRDFPERTPDLRQHQGLAGRKRYIIHGSHGYWFHHG